VPEQRAGSVVEASHRSVHPNIPGLPWWAALLIATIATAIGYAIDAGSGHKDLTDVFSFLYIAGCVVAVLVVRQSGVFTAVIQPPLILFCAVPGAYWLFHGGKVGNLKDLLINCGYPLIERFPLMLGTSGGVLLIGLIRWYFGLTHRPTTNAADASDAAETSETKSVVSGMAAKLASLLSRDANDEDEGSSADAERVKAVERRSRSARGTRSAAQASDRRSARTRSRHSRAPLEQDYEAPAERRRNSSRRGSGSTRDFDPNERRPRRRPRPAGDYEPNAQPPRETRRDPYGRRSGYERPAPRGDRYGDFSPYEAYEPYEPPRRRTPNGTGPTHHPISQVRYRGSAPRDPYDEDPRPERRGRSRTPGRPPAQSWEYDG
jgi:hypothetical protein